MSAGSTAAREQVARLLTLVPYLHTRGEVRLDEAARALGVPPAQLVSDLKVLLMCGLPGGYPDDLIDVDLDALEGSDGDQVLRVSNADYLARPLRLSPTEASAMIVALRALRAGTGDATREVVDRALAKLEQAAADGPGDPEGPGALRVDPGADAVDPDRAELIVLLRDATTRRRQVRMRYYVPTRDEQSERIVDPRGVVPHGDHDYLDAWCHSADAPRLFRLDRIADVEVLDSPVPTPVVAPRDLGGGFFDPASDVTTATLRLAPAAQWVVEYYPVARVAPLSDGRLEVDLLVADPRWLTRLLLRLAPHAEVVSPAEWAGRFTEEAQRTLRLYA